MTFSFIQYRTAGTDRAVALVTESGRAKRVAGARTVYELATNAITAGRSLVEMAQDAGLTEEVDIKAIAREERLLPPIDHEEPARMYLTGTGLTHLGSAKSRDSMHNTTQTEPLTDSMKMFQMGIAGGKPNDGESGVQPEWFYKGNGETVAAPGSSIVSPAFAQDGGEEPEIAGIYLIGPDRMPARLGYCLANEFSDHVTEKVNYLWLAHSKLRQAALGPELLLGELPAQIEGQVRIVRGGLIIWEKPFVTGEDHMSHSIRNLEQHHFKYSLFRRPGDIHVHFFGTSTLSFADGIRSQAGDVFEIEANPFHLPLRNTLDFAPPEEIRVRAL